MAVPKVLIPMADLGHDPTETSVPYTAFKDAGFEVQFATENGKSLQCDPKLLTGLTQKILGATGSVISKYNTMAASPEFLSPLAWTSPTFAPTLSSYNLIFLPGGHSSEIRQLLDSPLLRTHLATYFALCLKPSAHSVGAVCHGVLAVSETKILEGEHKGKSVLHECVTTTLPARFEQVAFWGTRLFLGDYYKTYGGGSADVEDCVRAALDEPNVQFKGSLMPGPFVVQDAKWNYISARFPGDVELLASEMVELVKESMAGK